MPNKNRIRNIISISNELHDDIDIIYESLMDGEDSYVVDYVEVVVKKLRALKSDLVTKID